MTTLNYVTVTGTFADGTGAPLTGTATFTPSQPVYSSGVPLVTPGVPVTAAISGGQLVTSAGAALRLLATDNAGLVLESRTGFWCWEVSVSLAGADADEWEFFLPWSVYGASPYDGTVDLYALANTAAAAGGGAVASVFGRSGAVTAQSGDYTYAQVGADQSGAAASAQTAAEAYAASLQPTSGSPVSTLDGGTGTSASSLAALLADLLASGGGTLGAELSPRVFGLTDAATILVNAALGNEADVTLGGNRAMGAPSNPVNAQRLTFRVRQPSSGGPFTLTWASGAGGYNFGGGSAPVLSSAASACDLAAFDYDSAKSQWMYLGSATGF